MSRDLIGGSEGEVPASPTHSREITQMVLHEPLRRIAPMSRAVAKCKRDVDTFFNPYSDGPVVPREQRHELTFSRIEEVLSAFQLLDMILNGGEVISYELVSDLLKILQSTISTQKRNELESDASMRAGLALFDFDIDGAGADLGIWDETPKHPMIVAFAVQRLHNRTTFSPSLAELAAACRYTRTIRWRKPSATC